jgi:hypothetical protein
MKTYVLRDNSHITQAIIIVRKPEFPISVKAQEVIDGLEALTDLHFLFLEDIVKSVDPEKFSELYQAASYSVAPKEVQGVLGSIEYDSEIWTGQHLYHFVMDLSTIDSVSVRTIKKLIEASEVLRRSIFPVHRAEPEILGSVYMKDSGSWWKRPDRFGMYLTHYIPESCHVEIVQKDLWTEIMKFCEAKRGYLETFKSFRDFLASVSVRLRKPELVLNKNPEEVDVSTVGEKS